MDYLENKGNFKMTLKNEENIIDISRHSEKAYLEYCVAVLQDRAISYLHDGQKPVQRRILHVMNELGLTDNSGFKKSARIVGDIIGKYHPHGDSSVYQAMVKMSQDFYLRYPLIDGQGNFGSRDGDSAAAMRYTEARLTPIASLLLNDLKFNCVNNIPNFDSTLTEPELLPSRLNFELLNGSFGIGVGLSSNVPSHNINDVTNATLSYIDNKDITCEELANIIIAPDLPTGGQIITPKADLNKIYSTGEGMFTVRCRWEVEKQPRGQYKIIVTELPPSASVESVILKIDSLENPKGKKDSNGKIKLAQKQLTDKIYIQNLIHNAYNDSEGKNLRLVIEPKNCKIDPEEFMSKLYKILDLEENIKVNLTTVGTDFLPRRKNLKEIIKEWFDFRFETVTKRFEYLLKKVNDRIHILEGRKKVFDYLQEVIDIIKSEDEPDKILMEKFNLSEIQVKDVLEIKLRQLAKMEINKILKELENSFLDKQEYEKLLGSEKEMTKYIKKEIISDTKSFSDERRTLVKEEDKATISKEEKIVDEKVTLIISDNGWLTLRKGHSLDMSTVTLKEDSNFLKSIECLSTQNIVILNKKGRIFNIKPFQVPSGKNFIHINTLIDNSDSIIDYKLIEEDKKIVMASELGYGFITDFSSLITKNKAGKQFLETEEKLAFEIKVLNQNNLFSCITKKKRLLSFNSEEIKYLKNGGKGVQLIKLDDDDYLIDICLHDKDLEEIEIFGYKFNTLDIISSRAKRGLKLK